MNYVGFNEFDTANGEGVRVSLFVSGCTLHCKGCFNPESWSFQAGNPFTQETMNAIDHALAQDWIDGLSILGGDPFEPENLPTVTEICRFFKTKYPHKSIWLWTGRRLEKVRRCEVLKYIDVLIDGAFVEKLRITDKNAWRGSSNQRVIRIINRINNEYENEICSIINE